MILTDDEIDHITAVALEANPHWEPDAWGLFSAVAKAQLQKIVQWLEEPCPHCIGDFRDSDEPVTMRQRLTCGQCCTELYNEFKQEIRR